MSSDCRSGLLAARPDPRADATYAATFPRCAGSWSPACPGRASRRRSRSSNAAGSASSTRTSPAGRSRATATASRSGSRSGWRHFWPRTAARTLYVSGCVREPGCVLRPLRRGGAPERARRRDPRADRRPRRRTISASRPRSASACSADLAAVEPLLRAEVHGRARRVAGRSTRWSRRSSPSAAASAAPRIATWRSPGNACS